jgi:hypothetical protein
MKVPANFENEACIIMFLGDNWVNNPLQAGCLMKYAKHEFNPLKPIGYFIAHQVQHSEILRFANRLCLCVSDGAQNKNRLFPYTIPSD